MHDFIIQTLYTFESVCSVFNSIWIPICLGESWDKARRLQEKMITNLVMARDRLEVLGMYNRHQRDSVKI